ncbi:MAG TPA: gamma-glutamylcyclotransferase [Aquabacterium sp.]|nr:gamma-glutamylcyclotransferase [Aquabacterium sp.]
MSGAAPDPFRHLPELRGRVTPPAQSTLRLTPQTLAAWDAQARARGLPPDWRWSTQQIEASRRACLGRSAPGEDLWIFGYGSLMWDPAVHFSELRRGDLAGHRRRFSYRTQMGRGTPERPALMLTLEPGDGQCSGLVFRIAAALAERETALLWQREMIRGGYLPTWLPVQTPQGPVRALAFLANPAHPGYVGELPLQDCAAIIATAEGQIGRNRDYLRQLDAQLLCLGLDDPDMHRLWAAVQALAPD